MLILYCRVIGQWLPTSRQSVGDQLGSDRQPIGDRSATGWRLYIGRSFLIAESLQLFGDRWATDRRLVGDQSATTKNLSTIDLVAERFHLQQLKPPCDQIVPATFCNRSATSRRPPCNHPATSLRPPEILVARRSSTGCQLCVAPVTHVLQPVGDCLATKKQLQPMQPLCDQKLRFSVADQSDDWSATTIPKNRRPVGDRSATGGRLIANWLEIGCDWSATGWRLVGDKSATDYRTNNLLCRCNHE